MIAKFCKLDINYYKLFSISNERNKFIGDYMWIEICNKLINFNLITKVEKDHKTLQIHFYTNGDKITSEFKNELELEQVYFNLTERIQSKPIDGFRDKC